MKFLKTGLILSSFALFISACAETAQNTTTTTANNAAVVTNANGNSAAAQPVASVDELASAREIYKETCAKCHKEDGTGGKVTIQGKTLNAENLTSDHAKKESDDDYMDAIKNGIIDEGMPAFKDRLNDQQIKEIVRYIRTEIQKQ
jgi:mono/diheme cytochrome c family protein